jgi:hypothetical protein
MTPRYGKFVAYFRVSMHDTNMPTGPIFSS